MNFTLKITLPFVGILQCVSRKEVSLFLPYLYENIILAIKTENEKTGNKGMMKFSIVVDVEEFSMKQMMYKPGKPTFTR